MNLTNTVGRTEARVLDAGAWIEAARDLMIVQGLDGLRIEPLAKILGVTKGSFYWHFRDRDALLEAILDDWRRTATERLVAYGGSGVDPRTMLEAFLRKPFGWQPTVELPIRLWARRDARPAAVIKEIDALRVRYMTDLFKQQGWGALEAESRAICGYSFMCSAGSLVQPNEGELIDTCVKLLLGQAPKAAS